MAETASQDQHRPHISSEGWVWKGLIEIAMAALPLSGLAAATWWVLDLPARYAAEIAALFVVLGFTLLAFGPPFSDPRRFGLANRVTLFRATLVLPITALTFHPSTWSGLAAWWTIVVSTLALALDGMDGWLARTRDEESAYGARFDMELDAFLLLVLSVLVWQSGRTGPWVILIGAIRYGFVVASWVWPLLNAPLPPSRRRKSVCVVQGVALLICLGPVIPMHWVPAVAITALISLIHSFAIDVRWLIRHGATRTEA